MTDTVARVLVVDDEENIREMLKRGLGQASYDVSMAGSAAEAAEAMSDQKFDLLLLDITMPGKPGIEFLLEAKEIDADVAVVMLTGIADVSVGVRAMREGAFDYINKPVSLPDLIIRVEHALSRRSLALENKAYQRKLEEMVDQLNARQEQRKRELDALNKLFRTHLGQAETAHGAYGRLKDSLTSFTSELEELATIAGIPAQDQRNGASDYKAQKVK